MTALLSLLLGSLALPALGQEARVVTLDEARARVREEHRQVQIAQEQVSASQTLLDTARAVLRPSVTVGANLVINDIVVEFDFPNPLVPTIPYLDAVRTGLDPTLPDPAVFGVQGEPQVIQPRFAPNANIAVQQTIYNARAFPLLRQAHATIALSEASVEVTAWQLEQAVLELYFTCVTLQRFIDITEANLELSRLNLATNQAALEEGVGTAFDVTRAEVEVSAAERRVQNARTGYRTATRQLGLLLGLDAGVEVEAPPLLSSHVDSEAWRTLRPELLLGDRQMELETHRIREQEVLWLPTFTLVGNLQPQPQTAFNPRVLRWNIVLAAQWDLYDSGLRRAERTRRERELAQAMLRRAQAEDEMEAAIDITRLELDQALGNVETAREEQGLAVTNVALVRDARELGAASAIEVVLAQQQLLSAELALADAEVRVQQKRHQLQMLQAAR
jgi:outer membrane protein TolC